VLRLVVLWPMILCCAACTTGRIEKIAPSFFGHYDLLSVEDRQAILATARPRVSVLMPGAQIVSVKVFSGGREVYATFARDLTGPAGGLSIEKLKGEWQITSENKPPK
jgi:hypothetical protein